MTIADLEEARMLAAPTLFESSRSARQSVHASEKPEETAFDLTGKRAVVVEDEGITQLQLRRILRSEGVEVVGFASNGREAVEVVLKQRPDFVLMDIQMPIMNGLEAARHILKDYRVCIVILTAFSEEEYVQEAQVMGIGGYVLKPVTKETLLPQLAAALRYFPSP